VKNLSVKLRPQASGVALVELMISLLIGLILMAGVFQIFVKSRATYSAHDESLRLQENLRFASHLLAEDLRSAGYLGCTSLVEHIEPEIIFDTSELANFNPSAGIQGWKEDPGGIGLANDEAVAGTDIFRIWRGGENIPLDAGTEKLSEVLVVSDCSQVIVAKASDVEYTESSSAVKVGSFNLDKPAEALRLVSHLYYIGKRTANSQPSLYRRPLLGDGSGKVGLAEELIEGVENMQLLYGVDSNGDREVDSYVSAEDVPDWQSVVSVKVALLLASADDVRTEASSETFDLLGTEVSSPSDRRMRRVMTSTIALRNRSL